MNMKLMILFALLFSTYAHAVRIEDVEVLEVVNEEPAEFQFKVRSRKSDPKMFFYLGFDKTSKDNLDKLNFILMKMANPKNYKLDLEIMSFSQYPAGSFYNVTDIQFFNKALRAPNQLQQNSKKK